MTDYYECNFVFGLPVIARDYLKETFDPKKTDDNFVLECIAKNMTSNPSGCNQFYLRGKFIHRRLWVIVTVHQKIQDDPGFDLRGYLYNKILTCAINTYDEVDHDNVQRRTVK